VNSGAKEEGIPAADCRKEYALTRKEKEFRYGRMDLGKSRP
jgi:hypothetical protein